MRVPASTFAQARVLVLVLVLVQAVAVAVAGYLAVVTAPFLVQDSLQET
jgi:hypothetical protein